MCRSCICKRRYQSAANAGPLPIRKTLPSSFTAKLRRIKEPARVQSVRGDKITPLPASVRSYFKKFQDPASVAY
jgi:hypothetical protein